MLLYQFVRNFYRYFYEVRGYTLVRNKNVFISMKAQLVGKKNIKIGKQTKIYKNVELNTTPNPYGLPYRRIIPVGRISIGRKCKIKDSVKIITYSGYVNIGENCSINPFTIIYGHGGVDIGNDVMIAAKATIIAANHSFSSKDIRMNMQKVEGKGIVIEDDVWIGANVTILDGVTIKKGCVVAAGSVVTKSTKEWSIIGGVPATLLKYR